MKKLLGFLVLGLIICNITYANKNKDIKFIVAIGKQSLVSKIAQFITNKRSSNSYNQLSGAEELEIISRYKKLVYKKNILFMTDVCYFI